MKLSVKGFVYSNTLRLDKMNMLRYSDSLDLILREMFSKLLQRHIIVVIAFLHPRRVEFGPSTSFYLLYPFHYVLQIYSTLEKGDPM